MKFKEARQFLFLLMLGCGTASCNNDSELDSINDSSNNAVLQDSMAVVKPATTDSASVITTPPTKDNNVILPDSSH